MSAFMMTSSDFLALANFADVPAFCRPAFALALHNANADSIEYRYGARAWDPGESRPTLDTAATPREVPSDYALIKLTHCFDYQSCEVPDYFEGEVAAAVKAIREAAAARLGMTVEAARQTIAYDEARWG